MRGQKQTGRYQGPTGKNENRDAGLTIQNPVEESRSETFYR